MFLLVVRRASGAAPGVIHALVSYLSEAHPMAEAVGPRAWVGSSRTTITHPTGLPLRDSTSKLEPLMMRIQPELDSGIVFSFRKERLLIQHTLLPSRIIMYTNRGDHFILKR